MNPDPLLSRSHGRRSCTPLCPPCCKNMEPRLHVVASQLIPLLVHCLKYHFIKFLILCHCASVLNTETTVVTVTFILCFIFFLLIFILCSDAACIFHKWRTQCFHIKSFVVLGRGWLSFHLHLKLQCEPLN